MKRQDLIKYHQLPISDVLQEVTKLEAQVALTNLELKKGEVKNVHQAKSLRADIARLKTIIRQKELTGDTTPQPVTPIKKALVKAKPKSTTKSTQTKKTTTTKKQAKKA